jgi:hypothetical protein
LISRSCWRELTLTLLKTRLISHSTARALSNNRAPIP